MVVRRSGYNFGHARKAAFLEAFRLTGNITIACERASVPRKTYYHWQEHDEKFSLAVGQAKIEAVERLEAEARRRAVLGVTRARPIFYKGEQVGTERIVEYSDTLLLALLKAHAPEKYRERYDVIQRSGDVDDTLSDQQREAIRQTLTNP